LVGKARPGLVADLLRLALVERRGDVYLVESPALLSIAVKLEAAGVELSTARAAAEIVQKHVVRAVRELVELFMRRGREGALGVAEPVKILETLRPLGLEAVRIIFGRTMEAALRKLVESGALASLPRKASRRRR